MKIINNMFVLLFVIFLTSAQNLNAQSAEDQGYPELCSVFNRTLKNGDTGTDVKRLQVVLGQEGISYLAATGYFGNATIAAVRTYQIRNGIYPAGKVGPQTLRLMRSQWCNGNNVVGTDNTYIPINTNNPELPVSGWGNGGNNWNNGNIPEVSLQPISSSANSITISWNTRAVNSCSIQQDAGNFQNLQSQTGQQIFTLYGEARFTLKCLGYNGREYSKTILVKPNQTISSLPTVNVSINPSQIVVGQQATLYWTSNNASYCTSNVPNYTSNLQTSGSIPVTVSANAQSYTFTCYSQNGQSISQTITANGAQAYQVPTINNFTYSNNLLAWGTSNTNLCMLSGGNISSQTVQNNGNYSVPTAPTVNTTWTLTCYGNTNQSVTRQVNYSIYTSCVTNNTCTTNTGNVTANLTSNLTNVTSGQPVTLTWTSTNATTCTLNSNIQNNLSSLLNGSLVVNPTTNTSYTLGCNNANGQIIWSNPVYVAVNGTNTGTASLTVTANPASITSGQSTTLNLIGSGMTVVSGCSISGGNYNGTNIPVYSSGSNYAFTGSLIIYPTVSTSYTVTCNNSTNGQTVTSNVYVTVSGNTSTNVPTVNISANPNPTNSNQLTNLTWYSTNATYCNIVGGNTNLSNQPANGSYAVSPAQSTNYTITCYNNNNQNVAAYVYVTVNAGGSSNTTGANTGANSCTASGQTYSHNTLVNASPYSAWLPTRCCNGLFWGPLGNILGAPDCSSSYWGGQSGHAF